MLVSDPPDHLGVLSIKMKNKNAPGNSGAFFYMSGSAVISHFGESEYGKTMQ